MTKVVAPEWNVKGLHCPGFARMLVARLLLQSVRDWRTKSGVNNHEHENQIGSRDTDGTSNVGAYVCASPRKCATGRAIGSVSTNRWCVGDFRFVVREIEIGSAPANAR